jgi:hypothetical protein
MRRLFLLIGVLIVSTALYAQVNVRFNLNVASQPVWGPTGYDHVEYYYLPDIEVYYNVPQHRFYYNEGGHWIGRSHLPERYHDYDFYNSYKVVVNERAPYLNHKVYRDQYSSFRGRHDQQPIRDSRDSKYFVNRDHPEHNNWVKQQRHDKGNGRRMGNDYKRDGSNGEGKHGDRDN